MKNSVNDLEVSLNIKDACTKIHMKDIPYFTKVVLMLMPNLREWQAVSTKKFSPLSQILILINVMKLILRQNQCISMPYLSYKLEPKN